MKRRVVVGVGVGVTVVLIVVIVPTAVILSKPSFQSTFMTRCEEFEGPPRDCQRIWDSFQQAYVNKDPCTVSPEAYDPLITAAPFGVPCGQTMFWSGTKDVAHDFTKKKNCFKTLEDTLLGSLLDDLTWCGEKGSDETFTKGCPNRDKCVNNPKDSFWNRASAAFADAACGVVTAMLNGDSSTPFDPKSVFATIEVKRLKAPRVSILNVVLVTKKRTNCANPSLTNLQNQLDTGIAYSCREVKQAQLKACSANPDIPCGSCW